MTYRQRQIDTVTAKEFADAVTQGQRPVTVQANGAAVWGNLDGVVRPAEALGIIFFFAATNLILIVFIIALWMVGVVPETRRAVALIVETAIFCASAFRLVADLLQFDPVGWVSEVREYRRYRQDYQRFNEWMLEQQYGHPRTVEHTATVELKEMNGTRYYLGLHGRELEATVQFARAYFGHKAAGVENLTAEEHWIGRDKVWPGGVAGRQTWAEFKAFWLNQRQPVLAEIADGRGRWEFTQAGEAVLERFAGLDVGGD